MKLYYIILLLIKIKILELIPIIRNNFLNTVYISQLLGSSMFGLCMWLRLDSNFQEWVNFLEIYEFYIGIYILLAASIFIVVITFIGCGVALMEHILGLYIVRHMYIRIIIIIISLKNSLNIYEKHRISSASWEIILLHIFFFHTKDTLKIVFIFQVCRIAIIFLYPRLGRNRNSPRLFNLRQ